MENKNLDNLRHSCAHLLAAAVMEIWPSAKRTIGPAIENGFYFDFDFGDPSTSSGQAIKISESDFPRIEQKMHEISKKWDKFVKYEKNAVEAKKEYPGNEYKHELIEQFDKEGQKISFYKAGEYSDLCEGGHVDNPKAELKYFKLLSVAGAYWRGDEKNTMLTRIYGTVWPSKEELDKYLLMLQEAKKRDHRVLGQELELFMFNQEVGPGLVLWLPKGAWLRKIVMDFALETYLKQGYEPVITPHIGSNALWSHSGHTDFYKESLYGEFGIEEQTYRLKPMNCPFHVSMYKSKPHSYKDLPIRWTEMGTVYRYEKSGVLHGLTRVRGFTQDDAHIICTPEQLHNELLKAFKLTLYILNAFGFNNFEANLSIRDPKNKSKFIGSDKDWDTAENELKKVLEEFGYKNKYVEDIGGAVFYGPKIDIKVADALGRMWQLSTLQFDFNLPKRFSMNYIGADGKEHTPYMIHRALLGSIERFIGVLIEHYAGAFPLWLAPVQVAVLPISDQQHEYAKLITEILKSNNIRAVSDLENQTIGKKIRNSTLQKIPYMIIIGEKETKVSMINDQGSDTKKLKISVRSRDGKNIGEKNLYEFITDLNQQIEKRI